eukprot:TRINITY_DN46831_c0_g1_i1.p1 TRINITY_DN46831_c0_g1~~TRINITY_DN46831_c0_g1_i1.p1  ORF type:complete len:318 (+),score=104.68 TRINITY_DN46831_c0_g1_i1:87-1040(+)
MAIRGSGYVGARVLIFLGPAVAAAMMTPALETLEGDFEKELQDLLEGTKLPFNPTGVPPSCHADVTKLCVHSSNPLHQMMWLNCLHDRKAELSDPCLEDYVRTLPFVCKSDEARFCEAQDKKRLQCLFGVVNDISGRCRLSVQIASIVLKQRKAKAQAEVVAKTPWHEAAERAIEQKHKEEAAQAAAHPQPPAAPVAAVPPAAVVASSGGSPAATSQPTMVAAKAPAAQAGAIAATSSAAAGIDATGAPPVAEEKAAASVVAWLALVRWVFALAAVLYFLGFLFGSWSKRYRGGGGESNTLMRRKGLSYTATPQFTL